MERPAVLPPQEPPRRHASAAPIAAVVRVFDRMADLDVTLELIRRRWRRREVHVVVVSNGLARGVRVPAAARARADQVVELETNPGREAGAGLLLAEGVRRVPAAFRHAVLLESDAWVLDDRTVDRAVARLERDGAAWASAEWIERWWTLALDFALADLAVLRAHPELFAGPALEARVAAGLHAIGARFHFLREAMPVHRARVLARLGLGSRRHAFPRVPMVTHHLEDLAGGLEDKMRVANACANARVFDVDERGGRGRRRLGMLADGWLSAAAPRSRWLVPRRWRAPATG